MPEPDPKSSWTARRKSKLDLCISSFGAQFHEWKERTETPQWSTHHSQVRAIEALLVGVSSKIGEAAKDAEQDEDFGEALPHFERAMLSGWRVWEFFRSKFAQRQDEQFQPGLRAADELAWACRAPLATAAAAANKAIPKEPALVFLNGNASPIALARGRNFWAEAAPGMGPLDSLCADLLKHVPVPLISLPWHEIWHVPSMTSVAHEAGHVVEEDFALTADLDAAITKAIGEAGGAAKVASWLKWRAEVFADFFAIRHCGPAFAGMLANLLAGTSDLGETYPPTEVRMELCFAGLEHMGLVDEANARRAAWRQTVGAATPPSDFGAVQSVVKHLATHRFSKLGGANLGSLFTFDQARLEKAKTIKDDLARGKRPEIVKGDRLAGDTGAGKEEGIPQLLAVAARLLYEEDPATFADDAASLDVIDLIAAVGAGTRRGTRRSITESVVSADDLNDAIAGATSTLLGPLKELRAPQGRTRRGRT